MCLHFSSSQVKMECVTFDSSMFVKGVRFLETRIQLLKLLKCKCTHPIVGGR